MVKSVKKRSRCFLTGKDNRQEWEEMKEFFDNTCVCCFGERNLLNVERDHVKSRFKGGEDEWWNIQPLCSKCNIQKAAAHIDYRENYCEVMCKILPEKWKFRND